MLTIEHELVDELDFPACYDKVKQAIQENVDMPGRLINRFIQLCPKAAADSRQQRENFLSIF